MNKIFFLIGCSIIHLTGSFGQDVKNNRMIESKKEFKLIKPSPLYILNEIELKDSLALNNLDDIDIKKIEVLNGEQGLIAYGKKGINGVVIITTKMAKLEAAKPATVGLVKLNPLYILDNVELKDDYSLADINPADISQINVLKSKVDIEPYGEKGKNGVVIIYTKQFQGRNFSPH